jgi:hypothetical protein
VGFPAWLMWKTVYMLKLPTWVARLRVALDWTVELFFERDAQLYAVKRRLYVHSLVAALIALGAGILIARQITRPVGERCAPARRGLDRADRGIRRALRSACRRSRAGDLARALGKAARSRLAARLLLSRHLG